MEDDARNLELLGRLKALCPMRSRKFALGARQVDFWTAVSLDPLLAVLAEKPAEDPDVQDERLPYWAELWPSALGLAEVISEAETLPAGPWLELGCGPGLPGIAAGLRGRAGIFSDYMPEALWLAELNARSAGLPHLETRLLDWRTPPPALRVPWILAADVAYEVRNFSPLLGCFETLLCPGGEIWFSEPGRRVAEGFFAEMSAAGWQREVLGTAGSVTVSRFRRQAD